MKLFIALAVMAMIFMVIVAALVHTATPMVAIH